jgi:DNA-binding response OmpR family regulator
MLGAAKSLAKPFELADLLAAVREVLEGTKD